MIVGCYTLDLYCDNKPAHQYLWISDYMSDGKFPVQFIGERGCDCRQQARKAGWKLMRDGRALCPRCTGAKAGRDV